MAYLTGSNFVSGASDEATDPFCDSCFKHSKIRPAAGYCQQCVEFYCQSCLAAHRRMAVSERHKILLGSDMPACQADKPVKYELCEKHFGEGKDRYCFDHDAIICGICVIREHKQCQVKKVSEACKCFNVSAEKMSFITDVGLLLEHIKETSQLIESNKATLEKKKQEVLTVAQKEKDNLLEKVEQSHQNFVGEVTGLFKGHTNILSSRQSALEEITTKVDTILKSLRHSSTKKQTDKKEFLELHDLAENVRLCQDKISRLNIKQIDITCTLNANIQPLTVTKNKFGELSLQNANFKYSSEFHSIHYPYTRTRQEAQNSVPGSGAVEGLAIKSVKLTRLDRVNVRVRGDKKGCCIVGVDITTDGYMMLVDYANCKVRLFSPKGTLLSSVKPTDKPEDFTVINKLQAAISIERKQIGVIEIVDSRHLSLKHIIKTEQNVWGITSYNNNLIITCDTSADRPRSVQMIDMRGKVLWTATMNSEGKKLFEHARFLTTCSGDDGDIVIVTDKKKPNVTVLDAGSGKVVNVSDVKRKKPRGVTVDDNGNVYMCYKTGEITVSSIGMLVETSLTTGRKFLKLPWAMAYNSTRSELVLTSDASDSDYSDFIHRFEISAT